MARLSQPSWDVNESHVLPRGPNRTSGGTRANLEVLIHAVVETLRTTNDKGDSDVPSLKDEPNAFGRGTGRDARHGHAGFERDRCFVANQFRQNASLGERSRDGRLRGSAERPVGLRRVPIRPALLRVQ